jgi:hypothetical protein
MEDRLMRKTQTSGTPVDVTKLAQRAMENPDVRTVLEIAARARDIEAREPAKTIGIATDIIAIPTNSQCPV